MYRLRFRQVHLDFHTSEHLPDIGSAFDKKAWQAALRAGHVNSITCFSKCHHGWTYHPTQMGRLHPNLKFDLLRAQFEACKEIDVNVPIYLSAGIDNVAGLAHPEWREMTIDGRYFGWAVKANEPGFSMMCFNTPYLDYLCAQIREAVTLFPTCDGIFLDIISHHQCCCRWCRETMDRAGLDLEKEGDRKIHSEMALDRYFKATTAAARCIRPDMPVFHNSGHIAPGKRSILKYFSHLELESLPTGGWGYDHFPLSAKYCRNLDRDILGVTGKFHTTWGEFGGFKHPNALRYECAAMLAYGSKCSVGDQLHPLGRMDESTYSLIGAAFAEVEAKERWCDDVANVADIAVLSKSSRNPDAVRDDAADTGACRVLLEGHFMFDIIDAENDFTRYRLLILPDEIVITPELKVKLDAYLAGGGKLFLTGKSGWLENGTDFAWPLGARREVESPFQPDFMLPRADLRPDYCASPFVAYQPSQRIRVTTGESLGEVYDPYFNRTYKHFCSHQHAPPRPDASGFSLGGRQGALCYLAHPIFSMYRTSGAVVLKDFLVKVLRLHLGEPTVRVSLPSTGRTTLMRQAKDNRYVLHLLYGNTIQRGSGELFVIEDLLPLTQVEVSVRVPESIRRVTLEPQGREIPFTVQDGKIALTVERLECHQMVVLQY